MMKLQKIYSELNANYRLSKKKEIDQQNILHVFYRKLSLPLTACAIVMGFSANVMTVFSFLFLLVGFGFISQGFFVIGSLLYFFGFILDFVDGNIARYYAKSNFFGKFIDGLVDSMTFILFISVSFGNYYFNDSHEYSQYEIGLGLINSFSFLFLSYFSVRVAYLANEIKLLSKQDEKSSNEIGPAKQGGIWGYLNSFRKLYKLLVSAIPVVLIACAAGGACFYFSLYAFALFTLIGSLEMVVTIYFLYKKFNYPRAF